MPSQTIEQVLSVVKPIINESGVNFDESEVQIVIVEKRQTLILEQAGFNLDDGRENDSDASLFIINLPKARQIIVVQSKRMTDQCQVSFREVDLRPTITSVFISDATLPFIRQCLGRLISTETLEK